MAAQLAGWIPKIKTGLQVVPADPTGQTYMDKLWQSTSVIAAGSRASRVTHWSISRRRQAVACASIPMQPE
jgi:hypothetical protein